MFLFLIFVKCFFVKQSLIFGNDTCKDFGFPGQSLTFVHEIINVVALELPLLVMLLPSLRINICRLKELRTEEPVSMELIRSGTVRPLGMGSLRPLARDFPYSGRIGEIQSGS